MPNSSYLDMNRDIEVLQKIVDDYEAAQSKKQAHGSLEAIYAKPAARQPAQRHAFALAS